MSSAITHSSGISHNKGLALTSWITFAISITFYIITLDPGVSYWDCSEYVTAASRMEVGHPPGNPVWMLAMRVATTPFHLTHHAYIINLCSAVFMAFAVFFLCRIIFTLTPKPFAFIVAPASSLCFALCDSVWFSAVEAEVYAMSTFLSSLSLWIITLWWYEPRKWKRYQYLILIAYLTGISLGVHQLNLLLIPVFTLIVLYRRYSYKVKPLVVFLWFLFACGVVALILTGIIPGILAGSQRFELFGVNTLQMPYFSGVIVFGLLILLLLIILIIPAHRFFSHNVRRFKVRNLYVALWGCGFVFLGISSFNVLMIRSQASPPMNESTPSDIFSLASYMAREQYPSSPFIYGHTPYSRPVYEESFIEGKPVYSRYHLEKLKPVYKPFLPEGALYHRSGMLNAADSSQNRIVSENNHGYILTDYRFRQRLTPELDMWFPRITSRDIGDREAYKGWTGMSEENMQKVSISEVIDSAGKFVPKQDMWGNRSQHYSYRPTYVQNLKFFLAYQAYYMYFRYLFWNFIGRQNDYPSQGEIEHGNFITGITPIDALLPGNTSAMPPELSYENKGRNRYFAIPFLFGIIGIIFLAYKSRKTRRLLTIITVLFLMTGLAIVVYLNQTPGEPRERDYTFLMSYMAFSMWIAAGFYFVIRWLYLKLPGVIAIIVGLISCCASTALMAVENFDDHNRRGRYEPLFYASSLLDLEIPAVIFSQGDNSTFPLWYASEVEGLGPDHTPIDITYLSLPEYVINLKKQGPKGISITGSTPQISFGKYLFTKIPADSVSVPISLTEALDSLYASQSTIPEWPTSKVLIPKNPKDTFEINLHDFTKGGAVLPFKSLMLLDILANQQDTPHKKALYFPSFIQSSFYKPLTPLLTPLLFGQIYSPSLTYQTLDSLQKVAIKRELKKLEQLNLRRHYIDPVIADRSVRYRGEMIIAAQDQLLKGDTTLVAEIISAIEKYYPYDNLLPGTFTIADSTFYEGSEYVKLLNGMYTITRRSEYLYSGEHLDTLMANRKDRWLRYYRSLSPEERHALSPRSKRNLIY